MNKTKIQTLLKRWSVLLEMGEQASKTKAAKGGYGLMSRIKRTTGHPVIFDFDTYDEQKDVQNSLCKELPQWSDVIRSKPEIMNGYKWTRKDFIELYFGHFKIIIEKLHRVVDQIAKNINNND